MGTLSIYVVLHLGEIGNLITTSSMVLLVVRVRSNVGQKSILDIYYLGSFLVPTVKHRFMIFEWLIIAPGIKYRVLFTLCDEHWS